MMSRFFISRPIFACALSVLILIGGIVACPFGGHCRIYQSAC